MRTQFIITADTSVMKVTLTVKQAGKVKFTKRYETVTQACQSILAGIGRLMEEKQDA